MKKNFYGMNKKNQGITLIALIITIIVLLILAGITITFILGENGILKKALFAGEESIKASLKEEIELAITDIQMENIPNGNAVTLETLAGGQLQEKLKDITAELAAPGITGEYKEYDYTIDSNYVVTIGGKITGIQPTGTVEILNTDYTFSSIQLKVTANITQGSIKEITAPSGAELVTDISTNEKIYQVSKSGNYIFSITADSGRNVNVLAKVENILDVPEIEIQEVSTNSFKIHVKNNYPTGVITKYQYYVENTLKIEQAENDYLVTNLQPEKEYNNIKVIAFINTENRESNIVNIKTSSMPKAPTIELESDKKTALQYPILRKVGMVTCYSSIKQGDTALLKISNSDSSLLNYYSLDGGSNWVKYEGATNVVYPGNGKLVAKSKNNSGVESTTTIATVDAIKYFYDPNILPTAEDALDIAAYDNNPTTYYDGVSKNKKFLMGDDIDIYQVCFKIEPTYTGRVFESEKGYIAVGEGAFLADGIFHTTYYGKGTSQWRDYLANPATKVYEIFYDGNIE